MEGVLPVYSTVFLLPQRPNARGLALIGRLAQLTWRRVAGGGGEKFTVGSTTGWAAPVARGGAAQLQPTVNFSICAQTTIITHGMQDQNSRVSWPSLCLCPYWFNLLEDKENTRVTFEQFLPMLQAVSGKPITDTVDDFVEGLRHFDKVNTLNFFTRSWRTAI